jgi:hypothetical protein
MVKESEEWSGAAGSYPEQEGAMRSLWKIAG